MTHPENPQVVRLYHDYNWPPTERENGFIEGYACALFDLIQNISGYSHFDGIKTYDPIQVWEGKMHSYIFNMKDGGRHHPLTDYKDIDDVRETLLKEIINYVNYSQTSGE